MKPHKLAIRLEKRWVVRDSLVQQIGRLQEVTLVFLISAEAPSQNEIFGAAVKLKSGEIEGWWSLDG